MPSGSLVVGFKMPAKPAESSLTDEAFKKLVFNSVDRHLTEVNIQPSRLRWEGEPDVPRNPKDAPRFVKNCLSQTGMDASLIVPKAIGVPYYCFDGNDLLCYSEMSLAWEGSSIDNPVTVRVSLGKDGIVPVPLSCMLTIFQMRSAW